MAQEHAPESQGGTSKRLRASHAEGSGRVLLLGSFHRAEISSDTPGPGLDHRARGVCHSLSSQGSVLLGCAEVGEAEWG